MKNSDMFDFSEEDLKDVEVTPKVEDPIANDMFDFTEQDIKNPSLLDKIVSFSENGLSCVIILSNAINFLFTV